MERYCFRMLFRYFTDIVDIDDDMEKDYQDCFAHVMILCYTVCIFKWGRNFRFCIFSLMFCMLSVKSDFLHNFIFTCYICTIRVRIDTVLDRLGCGACLWLFILWVLIP